MTSEEKQRICFNCSHFFVASDEFTEYGICLEDDDFEPYIDDLLENLNYASCQDLIDKKRLPGESEACEKYEEAEILEIDDDSPLGIILNHYVETGELDQEKFKEIMFGEKIKNIDFQAMPVEPYVEKLEKGDKLERQGALRSLGGLVRHKNREAFEVLFAHLKGLPSPETIEDVHLRIDILESLKDGDAPDQRSRLISLLIEELYRVNSNNTTRQWITKILQYLAGSPEEEVRQPLETLLRERKFSYKTREKIQSVLRQLGRDDHYHGGWW